MKFLVVFVLALATVSAELFHREAIMPVVNEVDTDSRITNGHAASVGQFPYQVGLFQNSNPRSPAWCGGSLIGNNWVLTAAHCTDGVQSFTVYLGATDRAAAEIVYTVSKSDFIIHPGWSPINMRDDISLIKIPAVAYTARIQAVRIPAMASNYASYDGESVIATGWGQTSNLHVGLTNNLQWARMEVISNSACASIYTSHVVVSSTLCTRAPDGISTCNGDSGGPLVLESSKVQIGLTSFGPSSNCEMPYPAGFSRLTSYLDWIEFHTGISY